ncbi:alpha/beta hydrolase [Chitinophaga agrisoli]|uniref:Alpha/beta hydrolase n=1 Tax=Chitinophaga agrisoli TaxID=2607653 RepID=A0A5B2VN91_9BACT|nr:alpha/beta hydrolase [Chitinophaga agrisoli]KAA2239886.1 alpha/beta hydrolase [Chitinophaga agrisoli]
MLRILGVLGLMLLSMLQLYSQVKIPLYGDSIINSIGTKDISDEPVITLYLPPKAKINHSAVIIFPGGAYSFLATSTEGTPIAEAFTKKGFAAFVVKYRLPNETTMRDKSMAPLQDAQQAIKLVRQRAGEWGLDTNKIGLVGFSAGGHLASTLGTHFATNYIPNKEKTNLRPDFMILLYPVISMDNSLTHRGSRVSLLGDGPSMDKVLFFSNEEQVDANTPPTYLTHTGDDGIVDVANSIEFYKALQRNGVDAQLHLFPKGDHGFIQRLPINEWLDPILLFLAKEGIVKMNNISDTVLEDVDSSIKETN